MHKPATLLAALIFTFVAVAHLLRFIFGIEILIGGWSVPVWMSIIGFIIPAILAVALVRERNR